MNLVFENEDYESSVQSLKMIWKVNSYNGQFKISKNKPYDKFISWESQKNTNKNNSKWLSHFLQNNSRIAGGLCPRPQYIPLRENLVNISFNDQKNALKYIYFWKKNYQEYPV